MKKKKWKKDTRKKKCNKYGMEVWNFLSFSQRTGYNNYDEIQSSKR